MGMYREWCPKCNTDLPDLQNCPNCGYSTDDTLREISIKYTLTDIELDDFIDVLHDSFPFMIDRHQLKSSIKDYFSKNLKKRR